MTGVGAHLPAEKTEFAALLIRIIANRLLYFRHLPVELPSGRDRLGQRDARFFSLSQVD